MKDREEHVRYQPDKTRAGAGLYLAQGLEMAGRSVKPRVVLQLTVLSGALR